jgi:Purple acid Phosphatase, N-terminal domain
MANRTHDLSLPACLRRLASNLVPKQSLFAVWTIIAALLIQQSAFAHISLTQPSSDGPGLDSELTVAGSVFIDSNSGAKIVRVTDSHDGQAVLAAEVNSSSFNLDSTRFFVNLDGTPILYAINPSSLEIQKQGSLFGSIPLQFDSCHWSSAEPDTIIGLGRLESADSSRLYGYDTRSGSYTVLKDFSGIFPTSEAQHLSKSWSDDNHFAFTVREPGSAWRFGVVWERTSDNIYLFDVADSIGGVTGFTEAHLDRSGNALIVTGDVTRVWRYRTQQQSESVQLESSGDSRAVKAESQEDQAIDLFAPVSGPSSLPRTDVSHDGRFSIFSSHTDGSRSDVFIAAVNIAVSASGLTWTHMANCTAAANSLQKTAGVDQADDAHATSTQAVLSGDAYVEFTAAQFDKERWCGLNNSNAIHQAAGDINFAIKLGNNQRANVVENGVVKVRTKYKPNNVFRVAVESGAVNYYKNGSVFYTSTAPPAYPLLVNASLVDTMAAVTNAMIYISTLGTVVSISPAKASVTAGAASQFTALVTGSNDTITWSATAGSVTSSGLYTAPAAAGTYTVKAACTSTPSISASSTVSVTAASADTTPPVISSVSASSVTASGATISWNTDEQSDTQVEYGTTAGYGAASTWNPSMVTGHSVAFGGLTSNTLYHYRVRSNDAAGNPGVSGDFSFTTLSAADTTPPVVSGVSASSVTTNSATITWTTNEASDTQVDYGTTSSYGSSTSLNASMVTSHNATLNNLAASMLQHFRVKSKDAAGNLASSSDFSFTTLSPADTTPPVVSGVSASSITTNSATITWTTNEASDTQVDYGTTSSYGSSTPLNASMVTGHSVAIGGLTSSTLYHYRVRSNDAAKNSGLSGDFSFTTLSPADTTPPVVSGVSASSITTNSATITWTTNEASDTQVDYGTTSSYGSSTALNTSMGTSHSAFMSGLSASTLYHYRVKSKDAAGNLAASGDFAFTTSALSAPPPSSSVITNHNVYSEPPAPALPMAGGTFVDPTFGTTIMRVTDENDGASNHNEYSYWPTFNLDSTRFFIDCDGKPMLYRFDPNNFQIVSKGPLFDQTLPGGGYPSTEDAEWSGSSPNVLYGYNGLKLWAYDVSARTYTLVKDFTGELSPGNLGQMSRSLDDNVFAFTKKDSNWAATGYVVWRRDQNRILSNTSLGTFDEVAIDKSGRYLVVKADFGGGVDVQVVDYQTGNVQNLTDPGPDYAPGHSDNGRGIVVGHDRWNNQTTVRSLATPHQFQTVISFGSDWSQAYHISMLADTEGWGVLSTYTAATGTIGPFRQEIFQASTDGSQSVRRLAHHHSVYRDYWDTPRGDTSRDGRFVAFTSNWGSTTRRDVFIIRVPQGSGSSGDTTPPVIAGVGASSITSSGAAISWTTNEGSDTQAEYGTTAAYGSGTALNTSMVTGHSVTLGGLSANTLYHYRVRSKDAAGNLAVSGDFTFTTPAGVGGGGSTQNVVWTAVVNCAVSGNSLQKTSGRDDDSDAGASSQQQIASGDGYVEFTAGVSGKNRFCGLTHSVSGTDFAAIDFAIKLTSFGVAEVRENNTYQSETTYAGSDVFRVAIVGGVVKYFKNGVVFYTSGSAPAYPLRVDAALINLSGTVNNAVISAATGGALAVNLSKGSADVGDAQGQIFAARDLLGVVSRKGKVEMTLPRSLRRNVALG